MKKQRYIVEIEMPDGDYISARWLKDLIQTDCDVEDEGRKKVTAQETSLPSNLDEAAIDAAQLDIQDRQIMEATNDEILRYSRIFRRGFKAGTEWMAGQGYTRERTVDRTPLNGPAGICMNLHDSTGFKIGDKVVVQIRKK